MPPRLLLALCLLAPAVSAAPSTTATSPLPRVLERFEVGGDGWWDYATVDPAGGRLYLAHGTRVEVLDLAGHRVGALAGFRGVHGIALAPALDRGFASDGGADQVVIFRLSTLERIGAVATAGNPDAIVFDPATGRVFAMDGRGEAATVIDAASGEVVATLPLGGKPEFAVVDGRGRLYVNIEDTGELVAVDTRAPRVLARWPLAPLRSPTGLAIDVARGRLFAVGANRTMVIVAADTGRVVAVLPIGARVDGAAFDPASGRAYASCGDGTLAVVERREPEDYAVVGQVKTRRGARTVALDPSTHRLYLPTAELGPAPPPSPGAPPPRPVIRAGSFEVLVVGPAP